MGALPEGTKLQGNRYGRYHKHHLRLLHQHSRKPILPTLEFKATMKRQKIHIMDRHTPQHLWRPNPQVLMPWGSTEPIQYQGAPNSIQVAVRMVQYFQHQSSKILRNQPQVI